MDIKGKTALITGASSGLGQHMARRVARAGARVGILGRDPGKLTVTGDACRTAGAEICAAEGEIADPDCVTPAFTRVEGRLRPDDLAGAAIRPIERPVGVRIDEILPRLHAPTPRTARGVRP